MFSDIFNTLKQVLHKLQNKELRNYRQYKELVEDDHKRKTYQIVQDIL